MPENPYAWRPTDIEAIRTALSIPVTHAAIRAINDEMAQLESSYPEVIPLAHAHIERIAALDLLIGGGAASTTPVVVKVSRKGAVAPADPTQLPKSKVDVIEYATDLLMEETETEYAQPQRSDYPLSNAAQRQAHVNALLLIFPRLVAWRAPMPTPFQGTMARG